MLKLLYKAISTIIIQVYWAGPLAGGVAAGLIYDIVFSANASLQKTKDWLVSADFNNDNYSYNMVKTDDDLQDAV